MTALSAQDDELALPDAKVMHWPMWGHFLRAGGRIARAGIDTALVVADGHHF